MLGSLRLQARIEASGARSRLTLDGRTRRAQWPLLDQASMMDEPDRGDAIGIPEERFAVTPR
jgi:hypothetical protein